MKEWDQSKTKIQLGKQVLQLHVPYETHCMMMCSPKGLCPSTSVALLVAVQVAFLLAFAQFLQFSLADFSCYWYLLILGVCNAALPSISYLQALPFQRLPIGNLTLLCFVWSPKLPFEISVEASKTSNSRHPAILQNWHLVVDAQVCHNLKQQPSLLQQPLSTCIAEYSETSSQAPLCKPGASYSLLKGILNFSPLILRWVCSSHFLRCPEAIFPIVSGENSHHFFSGCNRFTNHTFLSQSLIHVFLAKLQVFKSSCSAFCSWLSW